MNAFKEITPTAMREIAVEVPVVHWGEVGGLEEVKEKLKEAVEWPLKNSEVFKRLGIQPPKGILLIGPPGCGKTMLARAVATESEANFISIKGAEIFSRWVGESEKAIREIFRKARMASPMVIFFDEVDSLVPRRGQGDGDSGVTERVISQLLTEMDGIMPLEDIIVIAATNRPDIVDSAVLRPGRFDRLIYVPEPDEAARLEIFKIHTKNMPLSNDVDIKEHRMTKGYSGADISSVCREAAMNALRRDINAKEVTFSDFKKAMEEVPPSISPEIEKWYRSFMNQVRKLQKPAPFVV
jgi:transitional endoplasmic reticulum ATPase